MKTSPDKHVAFYPETHEYFDFYGNKFISVTTLLKRYFPFEAREISEEVRGIPSSIYFGREAQDIRAEWGQTAICGTGLHAACERWVNTGETAEDAYAQGVSNFSEYFYGIDRKDLQAEVIIYDERLHIAGTLDLLQDVGPLSLLWDIKTCRRMDELKLFHFSMQLELYRRFAQQNYGKPVCIRGILWFEGYFKNKEARLKILDTVPCDQEVDALLERRKKELAA